ncbi:MAG: LysM peptidoglycan-binding domain-containing protein [Actinomycetota bacterium]|nr:LysM peptidoglycan-binding domain-containing protein [Actinomycetota bacterium]
MRLSSTGYTVAAVSVICLGALGPEAGDAARELNGMDFDRSLAAVATLLLVVLSTWTLACIGLSLASGKAAAVRVLARLITPGFARRAMFLGAAGALAIGPAAAINDAGRGPHEPARSVVSQSLDGLRLPDRPVGFTQEAPDRPNAHPHVVRVERGDTLWSIAARDLGPDASPAEVASATKRWHHANHAVIGPDPDLIFPHQQLTPPAKESR